LRIRVAGPGRLQDIVRSLGAGARRFPAIEIGAALAREAMDGIITRPAPGGKNVQDAPSAASFRGCCLYVFLIADKAWFERCLLPSRRRRRFRARERDRQVERMAGGTMRG